MELNDREGIPKTGAEQTSFGSRAESHLRERYVRLHREHRDRHGKHSKHRERPWSR